MRYGSGRRLSWRVSITILMALMISIWQHFFCVGDEICRVGDVNGDGRADGVAFVRGGENRRPYCAGAHAVC
jgi:hypothetical protein